RPAGRPRPRRHCRGRRGHAVVRRWPAPARRAPKAARCRLLFPLLLRKVLRRRRRPRPDRRADGPRARLGGPGAGAPADGLCQPAGDRAVGHPRPCAARCRGGRRRTGSVHGGLAARAQPAGRGRGRAAPKPVVRRISPLAGVPGRVSGADRGGPARSPPVGVRRRPVRAGLLRARLPAVPPAGRPPVSGGRKARVELAPARWARPRLGACGRGERRACQGPDAVRAADPGSNRGPRCRRRRAVARPGAGGAADCRARPPRRILGRALRLAI
ncbi:hypothetical protein IWQ57_005219, partial [Coemansia nantahalensis]